MTCDLYWYCDRYKSGDLCLQVDGHHMQQEQVRDEDHQVMPPDLNAHNVDDNKAERNEGMGGGAGDKVEEHEDPLDLKQMAAPDLGDRADGGGQGGELQDDVMQQQPPVNVSCMHVCNVGTWADYADQAQCGNLPEK